jgi:hypothetical protein
MKLKKRIMRRVYAVWFAKRITSPFVIKFVVLILFIFRMGSYVSFSNVVANMPSFASYGFFWSAFLNTETALKLLLVGVFLLAVWLLRDIKISFSPSTPL